MSWHLYGLLVLLLNYREQCPTMAICLLSSDVISPQFIDANLGRYHSAEFYVYICVRINLGLMTFQPVRSVAPNYIHIIWYIINGVFFLYK